MVKGANNSMSTWAHKVVLLTDPQAQATLQANPDLVRAQGVNFVSENSVQPVRFSVVVPVFNEQDVLPTTFRRLHTIMAGIGDSFELIFVNDGSSDDSQAMIETLAEDHSFVKVINFSRNFGHQIAISAGMDFASGDAVIIIDADLQDPPELIPTMIEQWHRGYEVVYAKRTRREGETWFKRSSAVAFYRLLRSLTNIDIPMDTGDFRLIDKKVCTVMNSLREKNRFVRGLVTWSGFRQTAVEYVRDKRFAGESKYPLKRMLKLSGDAITSFSDKPLKFALYTGLTLCLMSVLYFVASQVVELVSGKLASGLSDVASLLVFLNGIVLLVLGFIGQYLSRILDETRDRPLYVVTSHKGWQEGTPHETCAKG